MKSNPQDHFKEFEIAYKNAKTSKEKFKVLRPNTYFLESYSHSKVPFYFEELIKMANDEGETRGVYVYYLYLNSYYRNQGLYDKGLKLLLLSKQFFFETGELETYYKTISDIAVSMYELGQKRQAVYLWKEILNFEDKFKEASQLHILKINIIYSSLVDFNITDDVESAIFEMLNYIDSQKEVTNLIHNTANALFSLYYYKKEMYKEAIEHALKSVEIAKSCNDIHNLFDVYLILSDCYEKLKDKKKWLKCLIKAKNQSKDKKSYIKAIPVYDSLYLYYKSKEDYKNALKYQKEKHVLELYKINQQNEINTMLNNLGFENNDSLNDFLLNEYSKRYLFNFDRDVFLENLNGTLVKINIDSIVYVSSKSKMIQIHFVDKTSLVFKINMKDFSNLVSEKFGDHHLLFNTNLRSQIVNLFWMSKLDKLKKMLFVNVLGEELTFNLTVTQHNRLKDYLKLV